MTSNHKLSPGDLEELLPWHAAGTLDSDEAAEVERAIAADPELARRFALVREELTETILLNESLGAPSARAMETLFRAIDQDRKVVRRVASPSLGTRVAQFFSPRMLAWSASAAAVIVLLQAGVITRLVMEEHEGAAPPVQMIATDMPTYETAAAPIVSRGLEVDSYALVRFAPQASIGDINKFLDDHDAAIVDGPKAGGVYRVRVAHGSLSRQQLARTVKELEADKSIVSFAAPSE
jgi:anti-sigma factor RsiW